MRHQSTVTSLSWIPSEAVEGGTRLAFDAGFTHYDEPPPEQLDDLHALQRSDRFRFANVLGGWIETDRSGNVARCGMEGGGLMGSTTVSVAGLTRRFAAVALPDLRQTPERGDGWVRFTQTTGGRTGLPAPRRVRRRPYVQWRAPLVWTTLTLTIHTDGRSEATMTGASSFPRHWVYGPDGTLVRKSGLADFRDWYRKSFGRHSPWGDEDSPALVTAVETALERRLSSELMRGGPKPRITRYDPAAVVVAQGDVGTDVFLVLDGVVRIDHDGERLAEYGPGALLGERAHLQGGARTSSVVAVTACRIAAVPAEALDQAGLRELSLDHRREDGAPGRPADG